MAFDGRVAATWTLWGLAAALLGLANLAVMGYDPVPGQHGVVGFGIPLVCLLAAAAAQAIWPNAPRWAWLAAWVGSATLFLLSSVVQHWLGEAVLYGWGDASSAEAPLALAGAAWAGGLTFALRRVAAWWPGALATAALTGLYLWASSWSWAGVGAQLYASASLNGAVLLAFALAGWGAALVARGSSAGSP